MTARSRQGFKLLAVFFLLLSALHIQGWFEPAAASANRRVVLLHTLSPDDEWTRRATDGIMESFSDSGVTAEIFIEYMDITSTFWSSHVERLKDLLEAKFSTSPPDVVVTTGNEAATFALVHTAVLFGGAPIVFCGLTNEYLFSVFPEGRGTGIYSVPAHDLSFRRSEGSIQGHPSPSFQT
ncbi:MAG TPA: hypothetical protein PK008_02285 [Aminivibrio sp.]|uniref:hypothetical protein n=1 Tax=Aminivibrio sp. TaxID=1872489 RepID=UPI002C696D11|nr:hypothetical protein [Aminivibrio sp.]HPF84220.1 hypothetical protein [Aminivibrio sp.]